MKICDTVILVNMKDLQAFAKRGDELVGIDTNKIPMSGVVTKSQNFRAILN
nr:hypothetical protein [Butyrivibrio sp. NC2007]